MWIDEDMYYEMKSAYDTLKGEKSCKNCGGADKCKYMSDWTKPMRYNCPLWKEEIKKR